MTHFEELRIYQDNVELKNNVTVKVCDRTVVKDSTTGEHVKVKLDGSQDEKRSESQMLILGMGYKLGKQYRIEGYTYTFILNEFADLQKLIKPDRVHV